MKINVNNMNSGAGIISRGYYETFHNISLKLKLCNIEIYVIHGNRELHSSGMTTVVYNIFFVIQICEKCFYSSDV